MALDIGLKVLVDQPLAKGQALAERFELGVYEDTLQPEISTSLLGLTIRSYEYANRP